MDWFFDQLECILGFDFDRLPYHVARNYAELDELKKTQLPTRAHANQITSATSCTLPPKMSDMSKTKETLREAGNRCLAGSEH